MSLLSPNKIIPNKLKRGIIKNYVVVVEGVNDIKKIKEKYENILIRKTNGLGFTDDLVNDLVSLEEKGYIIILVFDPDSAGEKIRSALCKKLKNPRHIYLDKNLCIKKNKVGIENISDYTLEHLFDNIIEFKKKTTSKLLPIDLYNLGLIGTEMSFKKREIITKYYNIGHSNSKSLYKKLVALDIEKDDLERVLNV